MSIYELFFLTLGIEISVIIGIFIITCIFYTWLFLSIAEDFILEEQ